MLSTGFGFVDAAGIGAIEDVDYLNIAAVIAFALSDDAAIGPANGPGCP